jgi:hypothetical protein
VRSKSSKKGRARKKKRIIYAPPVRVLFDSAFKEPNRPSLGCGKFSEMRAATQDYKRWMDGWMDGWMEGPQQQQVLVGPCN